METTVYPGAGVDEVDPKEINETVREYGDAVAKPMVEAHWLRLFLVFAFVMCAGLLMLLRHEQMKKKDVIYVRIDERGRTDIPSVGELSYTPREVEIAWWLKQFVYLHYSRRAATVKDDYTRSMYLLASPLSERIRSGNEPDRILKETLTSQYEQEVKVRKWKATELRSLPYSAQIDYDLITTMRTSGTVVKTEDFTATIQFHFTPSTEIPESLILSNYNPLGLTIEYFRTDEGIAAK